VGEKRSSPSAAFVLDSAWEGQNGPTVFCYNAGEFDMPGYFFWRGEAGEI